MNLQVLARLLLVVGTLLVALGADMLIAQLVAIRRPSLDLAPQVLNVERSYRNPSPIFHHGFVPMIEVPDSRWGPLRYPFITNSLGFRDASRRVIPLQGTGQRVLFIGDSFTEGLGVSYDRTFVGLVDAELRRSNVEVLNAASTSYSPAVYFAKIKYLIETLGLSFDEVVVYLDMSDVLDDAVSYHLDEDDHVVATGKTGEGPQSDYLQRSALDRFLYRHTYLLKTIVVSIRDGELRLAPRDALAMSVNNRRAAWTFDPARFDEYGRAGLQVATANMTRLAKLLAAHGIPLTLAVYPWPGQILFDSLASKQVTHWQQWADTQGVSFLNYFPAFLSPPDRQAVIQRFFLRGDVHWSPEGHRLIADGYLEHRRNPRRPQ